MLLVSKRGRECNLGHSANGCESWSSAWLKPGTRNFGLSLRWAGAHTTCTILQCFPRLISRALDQKHKWVLNQCPFEVVSFAISGFWHTYVLVPKLYSEHYNLSSKSLLLLCFLLLKFFIWLQKYFFQILLNFLPSLCYLSIICSTFAHTVFIQLYFWICFLL